MSIAGTETKVAAIEEGYESRLSDRETAALQLTDDLIGLPGRLTLDQIAQIKEQYTDEEIAELALGVGLFLGMSKVLIALGLEPESMETTILPTPGS